MRLFSKIAITMAATVLLATLGSAGAIALIFIPQYKDMDRNAASSNAARVYEFLQNELQTAASYAVDWGHWDETFEFAKKTTDRAFVQRNLKPDDLKTIRVDEIVIAGFDRSIRFEHKADQSPTAGAVPFSGQRSILQRHWRELKDEDRAVHVGYANTAAGPAIIAMTAITNSNGEGPSPGVLVMSRLVSKAFLQDVREKTQLDFDLAPYAAQTTKAEIVRAGGPKSISVALRKSGDIIDADVTLADVSGTPSFSVRVRTPARFEQMAFATLWVVLGVLILIGMLAALVLAAFMHRVVTGPLENIIAHTDMIASTNDLDRPLAFVRKDEIGALAGAFDRMIVDLRAARQQIEEQSFVSGMTNMAAEMLHNIRNSLSPVATAVWKGRESLNDIRTDRLTQVGEAIAKTEGERNAKLGEYVAASAQHISDRCGAVAAQLETIDVFTNEIELVLKHHEELSRGVRHLESVSLAEVATSAAKLVRAPIKVSITANVERMPQVAAQRVVLLQAVGNVVVNAMQSIQRSGTAPGEITFDARDLGDYVELLIIDNGAGIPDEHKPSLFRRGFTSRPGQGSGLGLHYCATNLNAMNGSIEAESEGAGKGATFKIKLPVTAHREQAA
ncbi:MAG: CHASE4 domain-containing protein [Alphaproteobacteria bacterium]|nr:CHASE4 domain-containing protein [Alphaproteobacteria bacterium]